MSIDPLSFLALFARLAGLFLLSPLFTYRSIPFVLRLVFTLLLAGLFANTFPLPSSFSSTPLLFVLTLLKEGALGFLIGLIFAFLLQSAALAGKIVGTMGGFSVTELLQQGSRLPTEVMSRLFVISSLLFLIAFDFHHFLLLTIKESLFTLPLGTISLDNSTLLRVVQSSTCIFEYALNFAFGPFLALLVLLLFLALFAKIFPKVPLFFILFPFQILVAFLSLKGAFGALPSALSRSVWEIKTLLQELL